MATVQATIKKAQISEKLKEKYFLIIPEIPANHEADWHERNRLSRSLAAFAIEKLADVSCAQAANAVTDGGDDNGIDSIFYNTVQMILWVVQAKAGEAPDRGENMKLCNGVRDLINRRFENFNAAFARLQPDIELALDTPGVKIIACQVNQGESGLGQHAIDDLNELKAELNQFSERFDWREISLDSIFRWLANEHVVNSVDTQLTISNWFGIKVPRRAYYGLVSARQLAQLYRENGKSLFEKNIRYYLGAEEVNEAIKNTVVNEPAELFYLNNGLTAICTAIQLPPGLNYQQTTFTVTGFSIVNGAQTVGSIATAESESGQISEDAKVIITLIEVGRQDNGIGSNITKARNTQNQIRNLQFVAFDNNQERIRQEMAISGVVYQYRPSDTDIDESIHIETAAFARAGLQTDTRVSVIAKKQSGQLFDTSGDIYSRLFNDQLTGVQLIRTVRVYEYLNDILANSEKAENPGSRRKMFYRHSRFFILHILARLQRGLINKPEIEISEEDRIELSRITLEYAERIYTIAENRFGATKGYLSIFNNQTDADPLAREVMQELTRQVAPSQPSVQPNDGQQTSQNA